MLLSKVTIFLGQEIFGSYILAQETVIGDFTTASRRSDLQNPSRSMKTVYIDGEGLMFHVYVTQLQYLHHPEDTVSSQDWEKY